MELSKIIESILFVTGEPTPISRILKITKKSEEEVMSALDALGEYLNDRGIRLVRQENKVMLGTAPEFSEYVNQVAKEELGGDLSKAALETLSIVVYYGPITRGDLDFIRGVNSSFTLRNLMIRGLIERIINPNDKRTFIYKPSIRFLQYVGVDNINSLPEYADFRAKMDEFLKDGSDKEQKLNE